MEKRKLIYGHRVYDVYEDGRVFSHQKNRFLRQYIRENGYVFCSMWDNGRYRGVGVHRIVAKAFIKPPSGKTFDELDVNHKDFNIKNNHVSNLEWVSHAENMYHAHNGNRFVAQIEKCKQNQKSWIGNKIGNRTVVGLTGKKNKAGNYKVKVKCDCGNVLEMYYNDFKKNKSKSCMRCR